MHARCCSLLLPLGIQTPYVGRGQQTAKPQNRRPQQTARQDRFRSGQDVTDPAMMCRQCRGASGGGAQPRARWREHWDRTRPRNLIGDPTAAPLLPQKVCYCSRADTRLMNRPPPDRPIALPADPAAMARDALLSTSDETDTGTGEVGRTEEEQEGSTTTRRRKRSSRPAYHRAEKGPPPVPGLWTPRGNQASLDTVRSIKGLQTHRKRRAKNQKQNQAHTEHTRTGSKSGTSHPDPPRAVAAGIPVTGTRSNVGGGRGRKTDRARGNRSRARGTTPARPGTYSAHMRCSLLIAHCSHQKTKRHLVNAPARWAITITF